MIENQTSHAHLLTMASFQYPELKAAKHSIRLLRIFHDVDSAPIACKLYSLTLAKCPQYVAVSYSWGNSLEESDISLNDKPFPIRNNVWNLLHEMRRHKRLKGRFFWIDAICIDQGDIDERNHQVGIMRQVYATAADVLVWLGVSTPQSDLAMDYVARQSSSSNGKSNGKSTGKILSNMEKYKDHQRWTNEEGEAFLRLCRKRYWSRVWIVQEIMNARHIIVFCGSKSFDWECLTNIFLSLKSIRLLGQFALYYHGREIEDSEAAVLVMEKHSWDNRPQIEGNGICLSTLIERYHHSECTNILDKVYGLLGLSSDADYFEVDYRKSTETVYNEVLEFVCLNQLDQRHKMKVFERTLSADFGFIPTQHPVLTVDEIMEQARLARARLCPEPTFENDTVKNRETHRNAQPVFGESEMETTTFSRLMIPDFSCRIPSPHPLALDEPIFSSNEIPRFMESTYNVSPEIALPSDSPASEDYEAGAVASSGNYSVDTSYTYSSSQCGGCT